MAAYTQRVRDNILPLSVAATLPEAFEEWSFTENVQDHEEANESCQLCDHEQLRYHFEIRNALTDHRLWVGSKCILQFGISVFENNQRLDNATAKKKLARLTEQMRLESCLRALQALADSENNPILLNALNYYRSNKHLTPKFAAVVFWKLREHRIDHKASFFKVTLRRDQHKDDLRRMQPWQISAIWPALSVSQRRLAESMGIEPPNPG
ncbi:MAG TPA: hypothetical protein VJ302_30170 [Blastocatellia bacterium]|nr:hypothetical protein [Blastocatellia bacterium]